MTTGTSVFVTVGIAALAVGVAFVVMLSHVVGYQRSGADAVTARRAGMITVRVLGPWMVLTGLLASRGVLADFQGRPPALMLVMLAGMALAVGVALSPVGRRLAAGLSLAWLVGLQAFRLPLELVMHKAAAEGVMPAQMSFPGAAGIGLNFDIVTGLAALVLAPLIARGRVGHRGVLAFNVLGSLLLLAIMAIAVLSTPIFSAFGAEPRQLNTWVAHFPFIWLPTVLVTSAAFGHILLFRKLFASRPS